MDLMSAIEEAIKVSKAKKNKKVYLTLNVKDGEVGVSMKPAKILEDNIYMYLNGTRITE